MRPAERLLPEVTGLKNHSFRMADDLERLDRVWRAEAFEAVALYAARVLEVLSARALRDTGLPSDRAVAADLGTLGQFNLLAGPSLAWCHALRRIGNDARHVRRSVDGGDAGLSLLFLERLLGWFFCSFRFGPKLATLTRDRQRLWPLLGPLPGLMDLLESGGTFPATDVLRLTQSKNASDVFFCSPALPAVLAELLLEVGEKDAAAEALGVALERFPDDLRLLQLRGLHLSRTGKLDEALRVLEPLRARYPQGPDDTETEGLVAGVYKRRGELERSQRAYAAGWKSSGKTNTYLGVNAATLALMMGNVQEAAQTAEEVRSRLAARLVLLRRREGSEAVTLNFWDHVTLAEAHLVLNRIEDAVPAYREAFERHPALKANHQVARDQAVRLLTHLGRERQAAELFG